MWRYTVLMYKDGKGLLDQKGTGIDTTSKGEKKRKRDRPFKTWRDEYPRYTQQTWQGVSSTEVAKSFQTPRVFPLNPIVNKSCKIKHCGNNRHQVIQNMILTRGF